MIHTTQKIKIGDCVDLMKELPADSIDTVVTSPPYLNLRNYGVDGQIGLENTLEEYHDRLLDVTAQIKRVMKATGVLWWNHGDSYGGSGGHGGDYNEGGLREGQPKVGSGSGTSKCMLMQNHRLVMRMIDEQGFILRNILIWHKNNGMPSSVTDRFSNKYEPVYMLVKQKKYWFDLDAIRVPAKYQEVWSRKGSGKDTPYNQNNPRSRWGLTKHEMCTHRTSGEYSDPLHTKPVHPSGMKNPGDVVEMTKDEWLKHCTDIWDRYAEKRGDILKIPTQPHKDAHFAIFPDALIEPLIKAACPPEICSKCGFIRERITEYLIDTKKNANRNVGGRTDGFCQGQSSPPTPKKTTGWTACSCEDPNWIAGTVLDPFAGSGTVGLVARKLNRNAILFELNPEYGKIIKERTMAHTPPLTAYFGGDQDAR